MSNDDWPGGFVNEGDVTTFNDHGVRYMSGGERSQEYLYMEDMPEELENKC